MVFNLRERSRQGASPTKLFLFKGADPTAESLIRSVNLIPGSSEFGYSTTPTFKVVGGTNTPLNQIAGETDTDFVVSVKQLLATFPNLQHVNLVVAWFGDDLRCGECTIRPKVEDATMATAPFPWRVGDRTRDNAQVVTQVAGAPAYGGSPTDRSVFEAINHLRSSGLEVTVHPFVLMDIPLANTLPSPYGGVRQPAHPWRGRITCHPAPDQVGTVDGTTDALNQVNAFFATFDPAHFNWNGTQRRVDYSGPGTTTWRYERFILHMATIAAAAGANEFLLGSELVGLTKVRGSLGLFITTARLVLLAAKVRSIVGASVKLSYAADWSEYHSIQYPDGSLRFHLDPLWADANIDFIAIDNYFPISDWREGRAHADWLAGHTSIYDTNYLKSNIEGGEYFDWYYPSIVARNAQNRIAITDGAYGKPWVYRQKDLRGWWSNQHFERVAGVEAVSPTAWVPGSKQITFNEIGCPAIEKGTNRPNVFIDAKSGESASPYYSNGRPDAAIQRAYIEAVLSYWGPGGGKNIGNMIRWNRASVWAWDARPYPTFPQMNAYYGDSPNWRRGHWITGRMAPGRAFDSGSFGPYAFTDAETPITRAGITYLPWPIKHSDITSAGDLDKSDVMVSLAKHDAFVSEFLTFPPSQVVNLTIFQGHVEDTPSLVDYPAVWLGRVLAPEITNEEMNLSCIPVSSSIQRPGLRRNYQLGCPHVLFGPHCQANKARATTTRTIASVGHGSITVNAPLGALKDKYIGGTIEWSTSVRKEIRTITNVSANGLTLSVRGGVRQMSVGQTVSITFGCNRQMSDCSSMHLNILNFGGQPFIPLDNPLSQKNQFY